MLVEAGPKNPNCLRIMKPLLLLPMTEVTGTLAVHHPEIAATL